MQLSTHLLYAHPKYSPTIFFSNIFLVHSCVILYNPAKFEKIVCVYYTFVDVTTFRNTFEPHNTMIGCFAVAVVVLFFSLT